MRLPRTRVELQRSMIILVIFGAVAISLLLAVMDWPGLPSHRVLEKDKYLERMSLLKFFVSLGSSVIVATWFVTCSTKPRQQIFRISIPGLSWAWTCLGISMLSAVMEIYLTYKDFHYWKDFTPDEYRNMFHQIQHAFSWRLLHMTYTITSFLLFIGLTLTILSLVGTEEEVPTDTSTEKQPPETNDPH